MKKFAVIVGGGAGSRVGSEIPKQFLPLLGKPVIFHTIEKFTGIANEIILVLPESHFDYWNLLCESYSTGVKINLVAGGNTRTQSVKNGLAELKNDEGVVAIHDAVRPMVSKQLISLLYDNAMQNGNAIPFIPVRESIRVKEATINKAVNRDQFIIVQTPQCFHLQQLLSAYENAGNMEFSDDASVMEHFGIALHLVDGENFNIKITYKEDLLVAEALLNARNL